MESAAAVAAAWEWTSGGLHRVMCMQGGEDDVSYIKNCEGPACAITLCKPMLMSAIQSMNLHEEENDKNKTLRIADLGCATGYNTVATVEMVVEALRRRSKEPPEVEAFFCDLPSNDFNTLFRWLSDNRKASTRFFAAGVGGSFYTRLFPTGKLHVAVSLSALHWLSQIPERVLEKGKRTWNKGRAWIEGAEKEVVDAYAEQSDKDLDEFLRCRKEEMVKGGVLFMLMGARPSGSNSQLLDDDSRDKHPFTISMDQAWQDLVDEGLIDEETRDGFNIPAYMRNAEEVAAGIDRCGGFKIEKMEYMKIPEHSDEKQEASKKDPVSYGRARANLVRATLRPMVEAYIGPYLSDQFFQRYENRVSSNTNLLHKTCFYGVIVVSATRV
ncbi:PREDICTED: gibberellic acid methyltransferase 2-like [Tarenaya hassleriana]|uniref:gibberellic acid methyltransferase 2-like n=1 Tax=Tarenaya hassleriana TaxID=28532 RepID=UPI00053C2477|nr:PREDICTED: gibberellic acid methyltransferase 2-like [Tarenaya hassleriana]